MSTSRALDLIARLAREEQALRGRPFLAPLAGGRARVRLGGLVCELRVAGGTPGWWVCRAHDARRAEVVAPAEPWQRGEYLALLPAVRLVLLEPIGGGAWAALPFNPAEAARRFGLAGPVILQLVDGGQPFERVVARVDGAARWYDEPDRRADPLAAELLRAALAAGRDDPRVRGLGAGERAAYGLLRARAVSAEATLKATQAERRLRHALAIGGAHLVGYAPTDGGLRVTWERGGTRGVTLVSDGLDVVSAGICLSGEDGAFDLTSIVGVVAEAPDFARWD